MSLESFYGGKQGISPVIRNSFQYIDRNDPAYQAAVAAIDNNTELDTEEKKDNAKAKLEKQTMDLMFLNSSYEDVWYNELCIIDTKNKANPNNGKLFRRTLKGLGDSGENRCAEYIGQIVGPPGTNPFMFFTDIDTVNEKAHGNYSTTDNDTVINWPTNATSTSSIKPSEDENPFVFDSSVISSMMVPGRVKATESEEEDTYNDSIKYTWFNIVDNTTENTTQSMVYLGFQIPYPSLDFSATDVDWNKPLELKKVAGEGVENVDKHPFYHSWHVNIPRGIRGNAAGNIRLAQFKDFKNLCSVPDENKPFLYDFKEGVKENFKQNKKDSNQNEETSNQNEENSNQNEEVPNQIGGFIVDEVTPPALDGLDYEKLQDVYLWVYDYTFYNKNDKGESSKDTYTFYLGRYNKEIKNITFNDDGTVIFAYSDATEDRYEQKIQWIKNIEIDSDGEITFTYNTKDENEQNNTYVHQLPFPDKILVSNDGKINVSFKDNTSLPLKIQNEGEEETSFEFNYVNSLSIDDDTKTLSYTTYPKDNGGALNNGVGLNYIQAMTVDEDYHLLAYYSSSQFRPTQQDVDDQEKNGEPVTVVNRINNQNIVTWKGQLFRDGVNYKGILSTEYWQDFGSIRQVSQGIRILSEFDLSNYPEQAELATYTPQKFINKVLNPPQWGSEDNPNPYYGGQIKGKTDKNGDPLKGTFCYTLEVEGGSAYYYDYNVYSWKYAGTWGGASSGIRPIQRDDNLPIINSLPILYWNNE